MIFLCTSIAVIFGVLGLLGGDTPLLAAAGTSLALAFVAWLAAGLRLNAAAAHRPLDQVRVGHDSDRRAA